MNKKAKVIIGISCFMLLNGLFWVGLFVYVELFTPPTETQPWDKMSKRMQSSVEDMVSPLDGEAFLYFYSLGMFDIKEDGNLITDKRVVSFYEIDGEVIVDQSFYKDIKAVTASGGTGFLDDATLRMNHMLPIDDFDVIFSVHRDYHKAIITYIQSRITVTNQATVPSTATQVPQLEATKEHLQGL